MINQCIHRATAFIALVVLIMGCQQEDIVLRDPGKFSRPINIAAPVISGHFNAYDLIERIDNTQFIYIDDDSLIHARIDTSFYRGIEELVDFDPMILNKAYTVVDAPGIDTTLSFTFLDSIKTSYGTGEIIIDSVILKSGTLFFDAQVPSGFIGSFVVKFPQLIYPNGDSVIVSKSFADQGSETFILDGVSLNMLAVGDERYLTYETTITVTGSTNSSPGFQNLLLNIELISLTPDLVFGNFGNVNFFDYQNIFGLNFFSSFDFVDAVQFKGVSIDLEFNNFFGLPVEVKIDTLLFKNSESGEEVELTLNDNTLSIDAALYSNPITPTNSLISLNSSNSNLDEAINIWGDTIMIKLGGYRNAIVNNPVADFITREGKLEAGISVDVPFWFQTSEYNRIDTMSFHIRDYIDSEDIEYVQELSLFLDFENGFPFEINAQIYMAAEDGIIIDSLFSEGDELIWQSADVDATGKATELGITEVELKFDRAMVEKLHANESEMVLIKSSTATKPGEFVRLYSNYSIDMNLAFEFISGDLDF